MCTNNNTEKKKKAKRPGQHFFDEIGSMRSSENNINNFSFAQCCYYTFKANIFLGFVPV